MTPYLFVYGTLMQNHDNPYSKLIQTNSKLVGKGFIYAKKYDLGNFPGIKTDANHTHKTNGELYHITRNLNLIFTELDFYEGYLPKSILESLFIRKEVTVFMDNHSEYKAWVYEYAKEIVVL